MKNVTGALFILLYIFYFVQVYAMDEGIDRSMPKKIEDTTIPLFIAALQNKNWNSIERIYEELCAKNLDTYALTITCNKHFNNQLTPPLLCLCRVKKNQSKDDNSIARILFKKFLETGICTNVHMLLNYAVHTPISLYALSVILKEITFDDKTKENALNIIANELEYGDPMVPNAVDLLIQKEANIGEFFTYKLQQRLFDLKQETLTKQAKKNEQSRLENLAEKLDISCNNRMVV